jgi:hypothetical protein
MRVRWSSALILVLPMLNACSSSKCKTLPASFELDVTADPAHSSQIQSIVVELVVGQDRWKKSFDTANGFSNGQTSIAVTIEPAPKSAFTAGVTVQAWSSTGGQGAELSVLSKTLSATPDGCNQFAFELPFAGADAGVDAGVSDGAPAADSGLDGGVVPDSGSVDSGSADTGTQPDAMPSPCMPASVDPTTIALYAFNGNLSDSSSLHLDAMDPNGALGFINTGPCGQALHIPRTGGDWATVGSNAAFEVTSGAVDFWVQFEELPSNRAFGVLSRNAGGSGDLHLMLACDGTLVAEITGGGGEHFALCSNTAVSANSWHYVGINFGPPGHELWVDGQRASRGGSVGLFDQGCHTNVQCGTASTLVPSMASWVFGAFDNAGSIGDAAKGADLDELRISHARRSF